MVADQAERRCPKCGQSKPLSSYGRKQGRKDGTRSRCRACHNAAAQQERSLPGAALRSSAIKLKSKYGLTPAQWDVLLVVQAGRCALCAKPLHRPCVDHDHTTGVVRGLLCDNCNTGLGKFQDDSVALRAAAVYVEAFR